MNVKRGLAWILFIVLVVPLLGCATRRMARTDAETLGERQYALEAPPAVEPEADMNKAGLALGTSGDEAGLSQAADLARMIIYNVSLDLIVKDTEKVFGEIQRLTEEMGGYVSESNVWREEGHPRASLTVRVPAGKLNDAMDQFSALAVDVERKSIDSQDVTEDYVDLEARLKNEQRTEAELLELLESRSATGRTEDILEVHRELSQVRGRVEQLQGRMRYLENLSDMATIRVSLTPDVLVQPIVVGGWQPQGTARNAVRLLLRALQFFVDVAIFFFLFILPVLLVIAIPLTALYFVVRALWRRVKRRRQQAKQAE